MPIDMQLLEDMLKLQDGDILIMEAPYEDAADADMFKFNPAGFHPTHSMLWIAGNALPVAHSVREGYRLPGIRLTHLPEGTCQIFRSTNEPSVPKNAAEIMKNWALSTRLYSREDYLTTYPQTFWIERQPKDMKHFYQQAQAMISGPATPYLEPRATNDLFDLARNPALSVMGNEGLRRAIKFASRKNITSPDAMSKGQRCTPALIAAYQAAVLAPIVKEGSKSNLPFKQHKGKQFESYADEVLIEGWKDTTIGKTLLLARKTGDYIPLFSAPFAVDQRYATPRIFNSALQVSPDFEMIGQLCYFKSKIKVINKHGEMAELDADTPSSGGLVPKNC